MKLLTDPALDQTTATLGPLKPEHTYSFGISTLDPTGKESEKAVQALANIIPTPAPTQATEMKPQLTPTIVSTPVPTPNPDTKVQASPTTVATPITTPGVQKAVQTPQPTTVTPAPTKVPKP